MIKEIAAVVLLILMLAGALVNVWYLDEMMNSLCELTDIAYAKTRTDDFDEAERILRKASERWENSAKYTHIVVRHSEVDATSDAFYEFLGDICANEKGAAQGSYEKLRARLLSIARMESIRLTTVF